MKFLRLWYSEFRRRTNGVGGSTCFTGAEVFLAVAAVGALASAYGTYQAAGAQKRALKEESRRLEDDAAVTRLAGEAAVQRQRAKDRSKLESFRAAAGGAGVLVGAGSPLLAEMDFAADSELEAQHVQYGYRLEERSKRIQAQERGRQAKEISPLREAGVGLLSSAGSIAGSYYGGRPIAPQSSRSVSSSRIQEA